MLGVSGLRLSSWLHAFCGYHAWNQFYRDITLLEAVGKIFARLLLYRLMKSICPAVGILTVIVLSEKLKPSSHNHHKNKDKINTKTKHYTSSGTCEDKTRIFLYFAFCSVLGLLLGLWSYAYDYDHPYVADLTPFLCFAFSFVFLLMLMLTVTCESGLTLGVLDNSEVTVTRPSSATHVEFVINV